MTVVAIDGPVASGKSTVARRVARRLGYLYLDTGAMYRAVGLLATEAGVPLDDESAVREVAATAHLCFDGDGRLHAGDRDLSGLIRSLEMGTAASIVSTLPDVRRLLVERQRELGRGADVVMEGRDIGTNVFPDAEVKVYLSARPEVRAERRAAEFEAAGAAVDRRQVLTELRERDRRDSRREVAPLCKADDAVEVDSSGLSLEEVVDAVVAIVREKVSA
ncbi:MAG: Cytidylate kinase [Actinobacteria bacterium ADurb.BinA094]|jgi:cytidylate kinase|nr:(d)CMP kinase [Acidobacteriota bacterium]OPZ47208.1 MAG: Cytidylate kinase [Actinobacteria bacterium ADurb.BinA094]